MNEFWLILGMVIATYSVRWLLFGFADKIVFPDWFSAALSFIPVAVLTALFVPLVLKPTGEIWLSLYNPYLVSGIVAAGVAWRWQNLLLTIGLGLTVFFILKWVLYLWHL